MTAVSTLNTVEPASVQLKGDVIPPIITIMLDDTINLSQIRYDQMGAMLIADEKTIGRVVEQNGVLTLELNEVAPYVTLIDFPEHANIVISAVNDISIQASRELSLFRLNVQARNIDWSGTIHTEREMLCVARERLSVHGESDSDTRFYQFRSGQFEAQQIVVSGKSDYQNVKFIADAFECSVDAIQHYQSCNFQISGPMVLPEEAQITVLKSELNVDALHLLGSATIESCASIQTDICVTSKQCRLIASNLLASEIFQDEGALIDHCMIRAASINLNNETSIHNASELVANVLNVKGTGLIENSVVLVNQYLYTTEDCDLIFKNAVLETDQTYAQGKLKFIENGCHRTKYLQKNSAEFTVSDGASIEDEGSMFSLPGAVQDAPFVNVDEEMSMDKRLMILAPLAMKMMGVLASGGTVYYNVDLEIAYDFTLRSLYTSNSRLFFPELPHSLGDVFTYSRLTSFALMGLTSLFPAYRHSIALGGMVMPYAPRVADFLIAPYIDMFQAHKKSDDTFIHLPRKIYDVTGASVGSTLQQMYDVTCVSVELAQTHLSSISMLKQLPGKIYDAARSEVSKKLDAVDDSDRFSLLVSGLDIALSTAQYVRSIRGAYSELTAPKMVVSEAVVCTSGELEPLVLDGMVCIPGRDDDRGPGLNRNDCDYRMKASIIPRERDDDRRAPRFPIIDDPIKDDEDHCPGLNRNDHDYWMKAPIIHPVSDGDGRVPRFPRKDDKEQGPGLEDLKSRMNALITPPTRSVGVVGLSRVGMFTSIRLGHDGREQAEQDRQRERQRERHEERDRDREWNRTVEEARDETTERGLKARREQRESERARDREMAQERKDAEDWHRRMDECDRKREQRADNKGATGSVGVQGRARVGMFTGSMFTNLRAGAQDAREEQERQQNERDWEREQKQFQRELDKRVWDEGESERNRKREMREREKNQERWLEEREKNPPQTERERHEQNQRDEVRRHCFGY